MTVEKLRELRAIVILLNLNHENKPMKTYRSTEKKAKKISLRRLLSPFSHTA